MILTAALVERPYGTQGQEDPQERIQSLLSNAESSGWWQGKLSSMFPSALLYVCVASQWRSLLGLRVADRETAKRIGVDLAAKAAKETAGLEMKGPRGAALVDAAEALCMAMALWIKLKLGGDDEQDAMAKWRATGKFG
jgi:hypothetical protein